MPLSVTSGNLLVVMTGHPGGNECTASVATYTDTRGLVYTAQVTSENVNGGQSNSCIITAPITSSGPQTVTRTANLGNYPNAMWVAEISGMTSPTTVNTSGGTIDGGTSISSGNVTSALPNLMLLGVASDNVANPFTSATPAAATITLVAYEGAFLLQFVSAGTYNPTFNKALGGTRFSAAAALISYTPTAGISADATDAFRLGVQNAITRREFHLGEFN